MCDYRSLGRIAKREGSICIGVAVVVQSELVLQWKRTNYPAPRRQNWATSNTRASLLTACVYTARRVAAWVQLESTLRADSIESGLRPLLNSSQIRLSGGC